MMRITYDNGNMIDYLYSASGVKLEVTHTTNKLLMVNSNIGNSAAAKVLQQTTDLLAIDEPALAGRTNVQFTAASNLEVQTTDYINGYILENGILSQIQMNGGYMTEDSQGKAVYHFYLQDHQGNNRMVVNASTDAVEQVSHYYAYGGIIGNLSSNEGLQEFKFGDKKLDRTYGLDLYDFEARQYDAIAPWFTSIDPLAEKYYSISPYAYCAGDPVNCVDPDGRKTVLFATKLPSDISVPFATHTFVAVISKDNKCVGYYAYGGTGAISGQLGQRRYSQDLKVINSYIEGTENEKLKQAFEIEPEEGMSEEALDANVVSAAKSFGNVQGIEYSLNPGTDETSGNCNTSSTTLLSKAGVSDKQINTIKKKMSGICWGFGSKKAWTKEEQTKAVQDKQDEINAENSQERQKVRRYEALQMAL